MATRLPDSSSAVPSSTPSEPSPVANPSQSASVPSGSSEAGLALPKGPVPADGNCYVILPLEERCQEEVVKPGSLIRIKSPNSMGKSSLMARVLAYAIQQGYRVVSLDLDQTNQKFLQDPEPFMQWFCASVGKSLGIRVKTEDYWDDLFGANDNSTDYFEAYLLGQEDPPLVLALDNFDRIFQYPDLETDLCGLLRGWHEHSKIKPLWEKLRLIIVHSQEAYAQRDINQSPFNVGLPIELGEFTPTQVQDLVAQHGLAGTALQPLLDLIGGHPYLVNLALSRLVGGDCSLSELLRTAATEAG